ncbi:hypothetical protein BZG14_00285 [Salinivibrio sp. IB282]|nr:hypothetical protein BZG14_00285 [Salinivibrio sp. IB282]
MRVTDISDQGSSGRMVHNAWMDSLGTNKCALACLRHILLHLVWVSFAIYAQFFIDLVQKDSRCHAISGDLTQRFLLMASGGMMSY